MTDLWRWSASDLAHAIRTRQISSRDAVHACLNRIEQVNPHINAIVECRTEEALAGADAADAAVVRGEELGPLHGVPVTIKVNVDQAGYATTNGVVAFRDKIATEDSPVVANWRKAGAVFIGRTNTPAFSHRWFTANELHGETLNPRNAALTPGGSSGGAAAAVATGMGPLAHGNDYGGSIRYPAAAWSVYDRLLGASRLQCHLRWSKDRLQLFKSWLSKVHSPEACKTFGSGWLRWRKAIRETRGGRRRR